jgi:hypothetical protein
MEKPNSETMGRAFANQSADSKAKILAQRKGMADTMRKIRRPQVKEQGVSNVDGGSIWDCQFRGSSGVPRARRECT